MSLPSKDRDSDAGLPIKIPNVGAKVHPISHASANTFLKNVRQSIYAVYRRSNLA